MEMNYVKIIQSDFWEFFIDFVSHSWDVHTMKITDLSILYKWENLKNRQCFKYLFAPLYLCCKNGCFPCMYDLIMKLFTSLFHKNSV